MLNFNDMIDMYKNSIAYEKSYITYLNSIENNNGHQTATWLNDIIVSSGNPVNSATPVDDALNKFVSYFGPSYNPRWKAAFKDLAQVVLGFFYANVWLDYVLAKKPKITLLELLAACALFASTNVVNGVKSGSKGSKNPGNPYASWDNCVRVRDTSRSGTKLSICKYTCLSDNNNYANRFIKFAILESFSPQLKGYNYRCFSGYMACHIWGNPKCPQYYSSIPNLVLLPSAIGGITDHFEPAKQLLQYHSIQLFGSIQQCLITPNCVKNITTPDTPKNYSAIKWRKIF